MKDYSGSVVLGGITEKEMAEINKTAADYNAEVARRVNTAYDRTPLTPERIKELADGIRARQQAPHSIGRK